MTKFANHPLGTIFITKQGMRYRIDLSYDGSSFCGWQIQSSAPSVQESLEKALGILLKEDVTLTGAGRTDTMVNAIGYTAHFDTKEVIPDVRSIGYKINAMLPDGIIVHSISECDDQFHARFSATAREYMYFLHRKKDPFMENYSYRCSYPLDVEQMNKAAEKILGTRDFSCFEKTGGANKTSICTVTKAVWETYSPDHVRLMGYPAEESDYLVFTVRADRFLRNMVRAIVGTLIEIGRGKHSAEWMDEVLQSKDRGAAGESVPGHALFLKEVDY